METGELGGAPAALAGDDLKFPGRFGEGPDQDRLNDTALADGIGQFLQRFGVELPPGLLRISPDEFDREFLRSGRPPGLVGGRRLGLFQQGGKSSP